MEGFLDYEAGIRAEAITEIMIAKFLKLGDTSQSESCTEYSADSDADEKFSSDPAAAISKLSPVPLGRIPVIDDDALDGWLQLDGKFKVVIDPHGGGIPLGQFLHSGNSRDASGVHYRGLMKCKLPGHENCHRSRRWKINREKPAAVDRALIAWILKGRSVMPNRPGQTLADAHMGLPFD